MNGKKILIVEDEPAIAIDIAMNLESFGYQIVDVVHTGEEALRVLEANPVDLVMLDINIGGDFTGIDIALRINNRYHIPFIYLTSFSDKETIAKAASTFPASYLVKPFKEFDIAPAIEIALIKKKDYNPSLPSLAKINHKLVAKLTPGEYNILEPLWLGYSNNEIADQLFISSNTVKTHIRNIYSKLDLKSKPELIRFLREVK